MPARLGAIVNDAAPSTPKPKTTLRALRYAAGPVMALVAVLSSTAVISSAPAGATSLSQAQAQATAIQNELNATAAKESALSQQYDGAKYHLSQIQTQEAQTQAQIEATKLQVAADKVSLKKAAVNAYISNGTQSSSNPLFASNEKSYQATVEYGHIVNGTLDSAVSNLTNSEDQLNAQEAQLQSQQAEAQAATQAAEAAVQQEAALQAQQSAALSQAKGEVATLLAQQQAAQQAAQRAQAQAAASGNSSSSGGSRTYSCGSCTPPPPSPGAAGAIAAAESQIGVPYVWGAASPGSGFDCSGLVMWAWGQAGVGLPHYSGAQQAATVPVPSLASAQPGDLLFWGPGGSEHVAMYLGGGQMIEAPSTGYTVHITSVRMDFEYIGRVE
jgi:peptidoglycan DL-endopeptidase CwlO